MDGCPFGGLSRHEFARLDDNYIYCQKCGKFVHVPDDGSVRVIPPIIPPYTTTPRFWPYTGTGDFPGVYPVTVTYSSN